MAGRIAECYEELYRQKLDFLVESATTALLWFVRQRREEVLSAEAGVGRCQEFCLVVISDFLTKATDGNENVHGSFLSDLPRQPYQDVEKVLRLRSHVAPRLTVRHRVRLTPSLVATLLEGLFEHPACNADSLYDLREVERYRVSK